MFQDEKWSTTWTKLYWSHYREVLSLNDMNAIRYYLNECEKNNYTIKQLQEKIKNQEYERLDEKTKEKLKTKKEYEIEDYIKHPIIIKNTNNYENISEKQLQKLILEDIPSFLKELGNGFTFIKSEYPIKIDNRYNYIDILLYNIKYRCYVVVELKITELKKEHVGQIQIYMNYIDKIIKTIYDNKTVGIIICKRNNQYVIDYCSDPRITSREYILI
jgi:predicted nuclease of restriction endonuclease-like (RecB) superfamily